MTESEVECFSGVSKTAQKSKTEVGIKTKNENVKLGEEDVAGAIITREKPATTSISVQEISVFFFLALEFEVDSVLQRVRRSRFFFL